MELQRRFESALWSGRAVVLVAVVGSFVAAVTSFFVASVDVVALLHSACRYADLHLGEQARAALRDEIVTRLVEVIDGYLLAAVLLVFSFGLYELFIRNIDQARQDEGASRLLVIESFDDLKDRLGKVIILILIVNLFRDAIGIKLTDGLDMIWQGGAIALIAVALYLSHAPRARK